MVRNLLAAILLLPMLVACAAPETEAPTPVPVVTPTLPAPTEVPLPIGDGGLISQIPCEAPCFYEIRVGETPFDQVIPLLEGYGISPCWGQSDRTIFCGPNTISVAIGGDLETRVVDGIQYYPSVPVTLEETIRKFGNPDLAHVTDGATPEEPQVSVILLWDSIKMRIDLPEIDGVAYTVDNMTQIQSVIYWDAGPHSRLAENPFSQPWRGYGTYEPDLDE